MLPKGMISVIPELLKWNIENSILFGSLLTQIYLSFKPGTGDINLLAKAKEIYSQFVEPGDKRLQIIDQLLTNVNYLF